MEEDPRNSATIADAKGSILQRDVEIKHNEEARSKERREDAKDDTMIESMFHFYPADPYYISRVEGLDPKK